MSPRKLTENDKQEILEQYRTSQATTSTLAKSYEVSSSTISRFLKNKLSSTEYEDLIQQKRLARTPRGEKSAKKAKDSTKKTKTTQNRKSSKAKSKPEEVQTVDIDVAIDETTVVSTPESIPDAIATPADLKDTPLDEVASDAESDFVELSEQRLASEEVAVDDTAIEKEIVTQPKAESKPTTIPRRRRRRSTTTSESAPDITRVESPAPQGEPEKVTNKLVLDKKVIKIDESEALASDKPAPTLKEEASLSADVEETFSPQKDAPIDNSPLSQRLILKSDRTESEPEEDDDDVDLITLKEMLGEDLDDFNDDDDDEDDEDWEEEDISYRSSSLGDVKILPLSQASFPRTCYLVIDRAAELIVKPLSEFADLGVIPTEENRETTLPVFDNHRIAKRFSHRRERIIKVPDGRMLQKTSRYLQDKGITRLLIDGQIYSLIN